MFANKLIIIQLIFLLKFTIASRLVIFSFDAFRPDYVNISMTPNLYLLARNGVQGRMRATFVTKTFPNHQSIATGLYQSWHGIINNYFIDPNNLSIGPFTVRTGPTIFYWDMYNQSVPIYIANQLSEPNRYSGSMQWPGSIATYTDGHSNKRFRVHYLTKYHPKYDWHNNIETIIKWMTSSSKPANLIMVYFDEPDRTGHEFGPFSEQVRKQIQKIDSIVGYFLKRSQQVGLEDQINLIILSDHGMTEMSLNKVLFLEDCNQHFPGLEYKLFGISPMYSVLPVSRPFDWNNKTDLTDSVYEVLKQCSKEFYENHFTVYKQEDIPDKYHYKNNRRILPLFIVSDEGYELIYQRHNWKKKISSTWGNHGYDNSLESMRPLFIAKGPDFKIDYVHPIDFDNVDLYPLMLSILRIPQEKFTKHNGTFANVRDMLAV